MQRSSTSCCSMKQNVTRFNGILHDCDGTQENYKLKWQLSYLSSMTPDCIASLWQLFRLCDFVEVSICTGNDIRATVLCCAHNRAIPMSNTALIPTTLGSSRQRQQCNAISCPLTCCGLVRRWLICPLQTSSKSFPILGSNRLCVFGDRETPLWLH